MRIFDQPDLNYGSVERTECIGSSCSSLLSSGGCITTFAHSVWPFWFSDCVSVFVFVVMCCKTADFCSDVWSASYCGLSLGDFSFHYAGGVHLLFYDILW